MLKNNDYKNGYNFLNEDYKVRMQNYFNPYGYDLERNNKEENMENSLKTKNHFERKIKKAK